jgi:DNA-binding SARP family transcriptional activator
MSRLRVSLFGRFQVESDGVPLVKGFESRKVQELFSYLLLYRDRVQPRETLADLLWGENASVQSRKYLRQALWQLQTTLKLDDDTDKGTLVLVDSEWVGINTQADLWLDVAAFESAYAQAQGVTGDKLEPRKAEALIQAVERHHAGLLEGWYHDWCIFERERLQNMYLAMLNKLMVYFEARREYETGLSYGQRILQCDRAHERTHWRMMRLYYLAGDRTAALRQYNRCVAALEQELGVKPARWTVALYEQIRADQLPDPAQPEHLPESSPPLKSPARAEPWAHLSKLEALLAEFQQQVRQYKRVAGLASND